MENILNNAWHKFVEVPIAFQGLVVESTSRCNAKCAMCYQSAGPKGSDVYGLAALSAHEIKKIIQDALQINTLQRRFHLAGGEAFINLRDCTELFQFAKDSGYIDITTTTNCFWAKNPRKAMQVCEVIREAGLTRMEISWDHWHLSYVSPDCVNNALEACHACGIRTNLRILTTKEHSVGEALSYLRSKSIDCAYEISSGPVFPTGRAAIEVDEETIFLAGKLSASCQHVLHLTINSQGNVYPCCAGADQTAGLSFGNVREQSIIEIEKKLQNSPMFKVLAKQGVGALIPILEKAGLLKKEKNYSNICHLCWDIFSDPAKTREIKMHFNRLEENAFDISAELYKKLMRSHHE